MAGPGDDITLQLEAWSRGDDGAFDRLFPMISKELHALARHHLVGHGSGQTLTPTVLVHEAYLRLIGGGQHSFEDRRRFFAYSSRLLRGILIDHLRATDAQKRGGGQIVCPLEEELDLAAETAVDADVLLALHEALCRFERLDSRRAQVVELRFFAGLTAAEIGETLGISAITARRDWQVARRWLYRQMRPIERMDRADGNRRS